MVGLGRAFACVLSGCVGRPILIVGVAGSIGESLLSRVADIHLGVGDIADQIAQAGRRITDVGLSVGVSRGIEDVAIQRARVREFA